MKEVYRADKEKQKLVKKEMQKKLAGKMIGVTIATIFYRVMTWLILLGPVGYLSYVYFVREKEKFEPMFLAMMGVVLFLSVAVLGLVIFPIYMLVDRAREKHLKDYSIDDGMVIFYDEYLDFCYYEYIRKKYYNESDRYREINHFIVNRINYADIKSFRIDKEIKLITVGGYHTIKCYNNEKKGNKRWESEDNCELRIPLIFPNEESLLNLAWDKCRV